MSPVLRVGLILLAFFFIFFVLNKVRKRKLLLQYSLIWILVSLIMIVIALFPQIVYGMAALIGIEASSNLVYLGGIVGMMLIQIHLTAKLSRQSQQITKLVQTVSILEKEKEGSRLDS